MNSRLNLRDLGGIAAADGREIVAGALIRCGRLVDLPDHEVELVNSLRVRSVVDLRTEHERATHAGLTVPGAEHLWFDVIGEDAPTGPARLGEILANPAMASAQLGEGRAEAIFCAAYRDLVSNPQSRAAYAGLFRTILAPGDGAVMFHCSAGKDRTGWAAAAVLSALGVEREAIAADYLLTNGGFLTSYTAASQGWVAAGGDLEVLLAVMSARQEYLDAAFDEMDTVYGGIEGYLVAGLGLPDDVIGQLRDRLLGASHPVRASID